MIRFRDQGGWVVLESAHTPLVTLELFALVFPSIRERNSYST